jgi:predicted phage-related endonuclease
MIDLSVKPTIIGDKVILRPFETGEITAMDEILKDKEVIILTGSSDDTDKETLIKWYTTRNDQVNRLDLAITLSVFSFNPRAKRVYEKVGFVLDSIDEAELEYEGSMIDSLNMVLTRQKWERKK